MRSRSDVGIAGLLATLDFPVVICSSFENVYAADFDGQLAPAPIDQNFQLEVQYAYVDNAGHSRDDYFLLDFVAFDQLPMFISGIEQDAKTCATLL